MPSFGEQLRREREIRNTAVEDIASTTQIDRGYLEALERNEFEALPGRAFGKFYIRAYAEVLGFDPQPLIAAYDLEQQNQAYEESARELDELTRAEIEDPVEPPVETVADGADGADGADDETLDTVETALNVAAEERLDAVETTQDEIVAPGESLREPEDSVVPRVEEPMRASADAAPELPIDEPALSPPGEPTETRLEPAVELSAAPLAVEVAAPSTISDSRERTGTRSAALAVLLLAIALLAGAALVNYFLLGSNRLDSAPKGEVIDSPSAPAIAKESTTEAVEAAVVDEPPAEPVRVSAPEIRQASTAPSPATAAPTSASALSVTDYGVGRRVVNLRLEGRADSFREGQTVSFATRVLGAESGEVIRHVWLHEASVKQSIELKLGGSHWRTHSRKRLWGVGQWQVEARDMDGKVLATATFSCIPASS